MRRRPVSNASLLLGTVLLLQANGCTVACGALGARMDGGIRRHQPAGSVLEKQPGQRITLVLEDGRELSGLLESMEQMPPTEYLEAWRQFLAQAPEPERWPQMGEDVALRTIEGGRDPGRFVAFDWGVMWIRRGSGGEPVRVALNDLAWIAVRGRDRIPAKEIRELDSAGRLPRLTTTVRLRTGVSQEAVSVPLESIEKVRIRSDTARNLGIALGLVVDVYGILVLSAIAGND